MNSVFTVTDLATKRKQEVVVSGVGQEPIKYLRKQYPFFTKFVLDGFEINDKFVPISLKTHNVIR